MHIANAAMRLIVAAMLSACGARALAEPAAGGEPRWMLFSGGDVWRHWAFMHAGALWSPAGLANEGFALKLLLSGGVFRYRSGALGDATVTGRQLSAAVMPGWRFKRAGAEILVFAGLDLQDFRLAPDDPSSRLRGRHVGARGGLELWHDPSQTMFAADASFSSIYAGNHARVAAGWRVFERLYLGPEAQVYATEPYRHLRLGVHLTAFKTEYGEWSGALGWAHDSDRRSGVYLRIGVLTRR